MPLRGNQQKPTRFKTPLVVTLRGAGSQGNENKFGGVTSPGAGLDVGLDIQLPTAQTANALQITKPDGTVITSFDSAGRFLEPVQDSVTALAGGAKPGTLITGQTVRVTTVASPADSISLPSAVAGLEIVIVNKGANAMQVFGLGTDTIDEVATATGVSQMTNSVVIYTCTTAGKWYSEGLATGFGGTGLQTLSFTPTVTAFAGGGQASATQLVSMINRVSTVTTQGDSVKLPPTSVGLAVTVVNKGINPVQVYGNGTETINGIATATGISQGVGTIATYVCSVSGNWEVPITALQSTVPQAVSANGALPPHVGHTYVITKAGVAALTLATPTATTDDGIEIIVTSNTANAHTITATGLLQTGTASVNVATFAAQAGAGLTLMAYQGKWNVICSNGITFS
jgi:hypothetical protein